MHRNRLPREAQVLNPPALAAVARRRYARHSWVRFALLKRRPRRSLADAIASHMESTGTRADLRDRFGRLEDLRVEHVGTAYDRQIAGPLAAVTGTRLGWFLVVRGRAPHA